MSARVSRDMRVNYGVYCTNTRAKGREPETFDEFVNAYVQSLKEQLRKAFKGQDERGALGSALDLEKLEEEFHAGRAVTPRNVRALLDEVKRLMELEKVTQEAWREAKARYTEGMLKQDEIIKGLREERDNVSRRYAELAALIDPFTGETHSHSDRIEWLAAPEPKEAPHATE